MQAERYDTTIIDGVIAGLSAAVFTARHGLDPLVLDAGESILRRNAHLENFPGFPAGVNGRELPPGCEEIDEAERRDREDASLDVMRDRFADPHPDDQVTHPSLGED